MLPAHVMEAINYRTLNRSYGRSESQERST